MYKICHCLCYAKPGSSPSAELSSLVSVRPKVFLRDIFARGLSPDDRVARFARFQALVTDLLSHVPASSVEVEKQHAGVQLETDSRRGGSKRAAPLQRDSYVLSAYQDHRATLQAVEVTCIGAGKRGVNSLLGRSRLLDTTAPAANLRQTRAGFAPTGGVKRRRGLLNGMLPQPQPISLSLRMFSIRWA